MAKAEIDTDCVKNIIRKFRETEDIIIGASDKISSSKDDAGETWKDGFYQEFKQIVEEIEAAAYKAAESIETDVCQELEKIVMKAENIKF